MAYNKTDTAQALGISKGELESRARSAGYADTESYATSLGKNIGSSGGGSNSNVIQNAIGMAQQAVQPAVTALQKTAEPLKARYDNLISSLKGQQETETNRQTVSTQNELGRRGIQGGGLADQTLVDSLNPITSKYSGQIADVGYQGNQELANLAYQVAQLQSNAGLQGLTAGIGQDQFGKNMQLQQQQLQQQKSQQDQANTLARDVYKNIQLPSAQYELNKPYYKPDDADNGLSSLYSLLGLGNGGFQSTNQGSRYTSTNGRYTYIE